MILETEHKKWHHRFRICEFLCHHTCQESQFPRCSWHNTLLILAPTSEQLSSLVLLQKKVKYTYNRISTSVCMSEKLFHNVSEQDCLIAAWLKAALVNPLFTWTVKWIKYLLYIYAIKYCEDVKINFWWWIHLNDNYK